MSKILELGFLLSIRPFIWIHTLHTHNPQIPLRNKKFFFSLDFETILIYSAFWKKKKKNQRTLEAQRKISPFTAFSISLPVLREEVYDVKRRSIHQPDCQMQRCLPLFLELKKKTKQLHNTSENMSSLKKKVKKERERDAKPEHESAVKLLVKETLGYPLSGKYESHRKNKKKHCVSAQPDTQVEDKR